MTAPSEDLVEQIARVIREAFRDYRTTHVQTDRAGFLARAVLASTPIAKYFRDLDHADAGASAQVEKVNLPEAQWQTMETAPRDGTHILIAFGEDGVCSAAYSADDGDAWPWKFVDQQGIGRPIFSGARDDKYGPTHWQPLPPSPTTHSSLTADAPSLRVGASREPNLSDAQAARVEKLEAALRVKSELLHKLGAAAGATRDGLGKDTDRFYFGSTNHADALCDAADAYDEYRFETGDMGEARAALEGAQK